MMHCKTNMNSGNPCKCQIDILKPLPRQHTVHNGFSLLCQVWKRRVLHKTKIDRDSCIDNTLMRHKTVLHHHQPRILCEIQTCRVALMDAQSSVQMPKPHFDHKMDVTTIEHPKASSTII